MRKNGNSERGMAKENNINTTKINQKKEFKEKLK